MRLGKTVALTADGTNSATALKKADVGFAMGISGTEIVKSASDITILDDNFVSVLSAVLYGRNIIDNVCRFVQFQITIYIVTLTLVFAGACLLGNEVFSSVQLLWIYFIIDTLACLALTNQPPSQNILDGKSRSKSVLVSATMWRNIIGQIILQLSILTLLMFKIGDLLEISYKNDDPFYLLGEPTDKLRAYTIVFQTFVFM